ncbi:unnamed protein product [Owenia fusiformis]|uniref:Nucleolar GTP-binding protein 2 n=1 Tax=Owenia fusiformis TaxID=6347 RepID=A0A8J1Y9V2_OWEFU|nr:unnamed protein product [Owenia fusiformis]
MVKAKIRSKKKDYVNKANHSMNPDRAKGEGGNNMRTKATIKRLHMYKNFKAKRDKHGQIIKAAPFQNTLSSGTVARVEPNRKWFGNTRVVTQNALQTFQEEMGKVKSDPYKVIMKQTQLPISLLNESAKHARVHLLDTESFDNTFGPKSHRKKPNLKASDMESLANLVAESNAKYNVDGDNDLVTEDLGYKIEAQDWMYKAGQSKRIWNELYKVIDSSDVIIQVLDARDPMGTRCKQVENYLKKEKSFKHLIFVLNKCDLVPVWVTQKWVALLSKEVPTLAFHASLTNPFGKGALIQLLRQFSKLQTDKKQISVGFIGYPNVGKSSVINTLRKKKVCLVAPIAGQTKVWQYITLMKRIFLIDCPGVVYPAGDTETDIVLKGVVRVENLKMPEEHIAEVLARVKPEYVLKTYGITGWKDSDEFLEQIANKTGKLLKGGQPDLNTVAKMVLNDWQRGKIPYYVRPPDSEETKEEREEREGKLQKKADGKTDNKANQSKDSKKNKPSQIQQDFNRIRVEPKYEGEDARKADQVKVKATDKSFEVEHEDIDEDEDDASDYEASDDDTEDQDIEVNRSDENSDEDNELTAKDELDYIENDEVNEEDSHGSDDSDDELEEMLDSLVDSKTEHLNVTVETVDLVSPKGKKSKPKVLTPFKQPDATISESKDGSFHEAKVNKYKMGGTKSPFVMFAQGIRSPPPGNHQGGFAEYSVNDTPELMSVEMTPQNDTLTPSSSNAASKANKKAKRKLIADEEEKTKKSPKLNSKQKRKLEREGKNKKIGKHFYESANVKNRRNR